MKIGIDARDIRRNEVNGIGRFVSNFLKYAPDIAPSWEFIVIGNQNTFFSPAHQNMKHIIMTEKSTVIWDQVELPKLLKREKIDIFFSPYYKTPLLAHCPTVITVHDVTPFVKIGHSVNDSQAAGGHRTAYRFGPILKLWSRLMAKNAAKILTVSNYSKKDIVDLFEAPEGKVEVIYEGFGDEFNPRGMDEIKRAKNNYGIEGNYMLYVGNFAPHKNVEGILKAYAKIKHELRREYKLVLGGKKDGGRNKMERLCVELGIAEQAIFTGFIENKHLPAIYSGAEVFLFPSFYEGFGLPPLEAMACGTPVISSKRSCIPEILGDAAVLVDPLNSDEMARAIEDVLTRRGLRQHLQERGFQKAGEYSFQKMSVDMLNIFEGLLRSN
ncbi:MAG: glycosyltransferase family 1 protein [Nitrospiraceae bacterium]|nr:MAG: glycosyltransferase family 1 protein [Nitrospiraceae bacterium]